MTSAPINKVALALLHEGKLLLARSAGSDVFQIPGGKVEAGDADDVAALIREIDEELGLTPERAALRYLGLFSAPAAGKTDRMVNVKLYHAQPQPPGHPHPCGEIEELVWLDLHSPAEITMSAVVRDKILPYLRQTPPPA